MMPVLFMRQLQLDSQATFHKQIQEHISKIEIIDKSN